MFSFLKRPAKVEFAAAAAKFDGDTGGKARELYSDEFMLVCGSGPGVGDMPTKL